ncbi:flagellar brake protein [Kineococcus rhizosphaerae]|uniref:C-di-GMP-binding flagellar brake protein YcgR n=1 Tax=Kineococcus rhizosphaerae TaxID=559628 RepID=A0A2T0RAL0_9ACTN|nr:PilZ domain-containing protein [Kineococcus rhizosphaerae]PRY18193.1 c-di-GMP-binding flagellar brake protein YcgR [Kineococcus rhizosphaerae]
MARRATAGSALTRPAPAHWPGLNDRVWVEVQLPDLLGGDLVRVPTRVEDTSEAGLVVAAPSFRGDLQVVAPGLAVSVCWAGQRGQSRQEFLIAEVVRRRVPAWELAPCSDVVVEQRRRYARVPALGPARIVPVAGDPLAAEPGPDGAEDEPVVLAQLVDLSEGGSALSVPAGSWMRLGRLARVHFDLDGYPVDQPGQIVRSLNALDPGHLEVVVAFSDPVPAADRLRRYVMQTQIRQRRGGDR